MCSRFPPNLHTTLTADYCRGATLHCISSRGDMWMKVMITCMFKSKLEEYHCHCGIAKSKNLHWPWPAKENWSDLTFVQRSIWRIEVHETADFSLVAEVCGWLFLPWLWKRICFREKKKRKKKEKSNQGEGKWGANRGWQWSLSSTFPICTARWSRSFQLNNVLKELRHTVYISLIAVSLTSVLVANVCRNMEALVAKQEERKRNKNS